MPGKRSAQARSRGSWTARLAGTGFALLLAAALVAAYLIVDGAHATKDASVLPTRVVGTEAVSIVDPGPRGGASPASETLLASHSDLVFAVSGPAVAEWTSDQMAGGTFIFIYLPNGLCLTAPTASRRSAPALRRCDLEASQRWVRRHPVVGANGTDYWQLRGLADKRCLTAGKAVRIGEASAQLEPCQASPGWQQQVAFPAGS
jgi:hypothetical protein